MPYSRLFPPSQEAEVDTTSLRSRTVADVQTEPTVTPIAAASSRATPRLHLAPIDGFRGLAALYVACVHLLPRAWLGGEPDSLPLKLAAKMLSQGAFAVSTFIVLSGFCLMLPVIRDGMTLRGGLRTYFQRRFLRIAPPFYLAFALSALLLPLTTDPATGRPYVFAAEFTPTRLLAHAALVQHVVPGGLLRSNAVFWSISVEWWIYFLFPPLLLLWRRTGGVVASAIAVVGAYGILLVAAGTPFAIPGLHYGGLFALGVLGAVVALGAGPSWAHWRDRTPWLGIGLTAYALLALICIGAGWRRAEQYVAFLDLLVAMGALSLLIHMVQAPSGRLAGLLGWRPLATLGAFSYSLYLIHYPLESVFTDQIVARLHLGQTGTFLLLLLVCLPLVIGLAYLFYLACERPFHHLARAVGRANK